jgi:acyl-CoA synthetase (NDP forming)
MTRDLTSLLHARSVAIVGISQPDRFGGKVFSNLHGFGYPGQVYGVNPKYTTLYDQPCYPSLSALPARPDLAILAVPNERLLPALREAAGLGVPAAFIPGSAFSVQVDGQPTLQDQLRAIAQEAGMVVCGPNCMGFHAFGQKLVVSGYPVAPGTPGGSVTFITHSGSIFDAIWQNARGVRFNYLISSGNEMVTTLADYLRFALTDPGTRAVGLFLETVRDPQNFKLALQEAAERDVPIAALKVGRTEQGARLAQAHSGALAGQDAAYDALFAHYGVQRVRSMDEMLDTLELLASGIRPPTRYIASIHDSGGERGLLVDLAEAEGVRFAPIAEATTARLAATLDPGLAPINPLDAWGTGNEIDRIYRDSLLALDADPSVGLCVFATDLYPSDVNQSTYIEIVLSARSRLTKPVIFLCNIAASLDPAQAARLRAAGIPVLMGTENGVRAIKHLMDYCEFRLLRRIPASPAPPLSRLTRSEVEGARDGAQTGPGWGPSRPASTGLPAMRQILASASSPLDEFTSGEFLRAYGISVAERVAASSLDEVRQAAARLGYPLALKTAMGEAHKSDRGGVRLNLTNAEDLSAAYRDFETRFGPRVLVQQMVPEGVEMILGLVNDSQFGALLALGLGGIFVEVLKDSRLVMLPATPEAVRSALLSLRGATALLEGARGRPPADVEAIVDAALRLSALAADLGDLIAAVDVNPLMALPNGAVAVDALLIPKSYSHP